MIFLTLLPEPERFFLGEFTFHRKAPSSTHKLAASGRENQIILNFMNQKLLLHRTRAQSKKSRQGNHVPDDYQALKAAEKQSRGKRSNSLPLD
jgi:hypothetical protein